MAIDNIIILTGMPAEEQTALLQTLVDAGGYRLGCNFSINPSSFLQLEKDLNTLNIWGFDPTNFTSAYASKHYTEFM